MKKLCFLLVVYTGFILFLSFTRAGNEDEPTYIPPSEQRTGDAEKGYQYLIYGDYIKSGVPYGYYLMLNGKDKHNYLDRTGKNASVPADFTVVTAPNGVEVASPNCLQCHGAVFEDKFYVGLGNTSLDFSNLSKEDNFKNNAALKLMKTISPKQYEAALPLITAFNTVYPLMETDVRGVNTADRLAALLVAHRDPQTLKWSDSPVLKIPDEVVPTDVPAWWLLKKKNAMFYNGFGRGDFAQFLMMSNILTVKDVSEAEDVSQHFGDVLAFIRSVQPPKYPKTIDKDLAKQGEVIFIKNCSYCHGSYGEKAEYPNLLIPASVVQTDSALLQSNQQNPQFVEWFNKSWFSQGKNPAKLVPSNGYVAPPLDGVWITAPYLHNGSVPTIEAVLNSKIRPAYWQRDFDKPVYDYEHLGWKYETVTEPKAKKTYNTKLHGYGNYGHIFGDHLSDAERKAVIEYLKTL